MRTERHAPEGLVRDRRRGSWIMIVPADQFIDESRLHEREARPRTTPRDNDHSGIPDPEPRVFSAEIAIVFTLAVVLSSMFWSLAHI